MIALRREMKIDIAWALIGGIGAVIFCYFAFGCTPADTALQGGVYADKLDECNRTAVNLCQSIDCENKVRASAGRLPRPVPAHCSVKDAGGDQ